MIALQHNCLKKSCADSCYDATATLIAYETMRNAGMELPIPLKLGSSSINRQYHLCKCLQYHYRMYFAFAILLHRQCLLHFTIIIAFIIYLCLFQASHLIQFMHTDANYVSWLTC